MTDRSFVMLDDIDAAVSQLSEFGKEVVAPSAHAIRRTLLVFAAIRGWTVVHHGWYIPWALERMNPSLVWLVLDPLFPQASLRMRVKPIRFTRRLGPKGLEINASLPADVAYLVQGREVGLVDDAADSGQTLRYTVDLVAKCGGNVSAILVCASTGAARASVVAESRIDWQQFLVGDFVAVHARDGCPLLPFSGRRTHERTHITTDCGPVTVSMPPYVFRGGIWEQIGFDGSFRSSIVAERKAMAERMSGILGRPAVVSDIPLLGPGVALSLYPKQVASAESSVATLFD
jgi:hypothetical protein